jgi:hypothetical protein
MIIQILRIEVPYSEKYSDYYMDISFVEHHKFSSYVFLQKARSSREPDFHTLGLSNRLSLIERINKKGFNFIQDYTNCNVFLIDDETVFKLKLILDNNGRHFLEI